MKTLKLRFFGLGVEIRVHSDELSRRLIGDFCSFQADIDDFRLLFIQKNELEFPENFSSSAERVSGGQQVLSQGDRVWVDYDGAQLAADFEQGCFEVCGNDMDRLHETFYLSILSVVGKKLDLAGMHKVHAFGIVQNGVALVGIGPSGVGKSTLLNEYLKRSVAMLSDDIPILSEHGVHPFPLRLSVDSAEKSDFVLNRRLYGPKFLKSTRGLKIANPVDFKKCRFILLEQAEETSLKRCSRLRIFFALFRYMVIGQGTPMVLELFWLKGFKDFFVKARIFLMRLKVAWKASRRGWVFRMSDDIEANVNRLQTLTSE